MWASSIPKLWRLVSDSPPRKITGRFGRRDTLEFLHETQKYIAKIRKPIDLPPYYRLRKGNSGKVTPATSRPATRGQSDPRIMRTCSSLPRFTHTNIYSTRRTSQSGRTMTIPVLNLSFKGKKEHTSAEPTIRSSFIQRYRGGGGFKAAPEYIIRQSARKGSLTSREPQNWLTPPE